MTRYNVHIYRELRLLFEGIEADSPEEAAAKARDRDTAEADDIDDGDGETIAALVDVIGDEQYEQSRLIDFEGERLCKAALELLEALRALTRAVENRNDAAMTMQTGYARAIITRATAD